MALKILVLIICISGLASVSGAKNFGAYPRTRASAYQNFYTGKQGASFADAGREVGMGIVVSSDGQYLAPYLGFSVGALSGRQMFKDGQADVTTAFTAYSATTELGLMFFPIARRSRGVNIFISAAGVAGGRIVSLDKSVDLQSIPRNDQAMSLGYSGGVGTEWILTDAGPRKWNLNFEARYRKESATLFNEDFDFSHMAFSMGFGW